MEPLSPLVTFFTVWPIVVGAAVLCLWIGRRWEQRDAVAEHGFVDWNALFPMDDEGEAA